MYMKSSHLRGSKMKTTLYGSAADAGRLAALDRHIAAQSKREWAWVSPCGSYNLPMPSREKADERVAKCGGTVEPNA